VDTMARDPCILVDGKFFIWTLANTMFMFWKYKMKIEEDKGWRMNKIKDSGR
jgi:hypothetical protein